MIYVKFYDHASRVVENPPGAVCEVVGWLIGEDENYLHISSWITGGAEDPDAEAFDILKAAVIKRRYL